MGRKKLIIKKKCKCGKNFEIRPCENHRKFCSLECSYKYKKKTSWLKGKKMSEQIKKKKSISMKRKWDDGTMDKRKKLLGDLNHSKLPKVKEKIRKTHEKKGLWTPINELSEWKQYKRNVNLLTNKIRKEIFKNWDGRCFYCNKYIFNEKKWSKFEPTIDHKASIFFGFHTKIHYTIIADKMNLCICCRSCNCSKKEKNEKK